MSVTDSVHTYVDGHTDVCMRIHVFHKIHVHLLPLAVVLQFCCLASLLADSTTPLLHGWLAKLQRTPQRNAQIALGRAPKSYCLSHQYCFGCRFCRYSLAFGISRRTPSLPSTSLAFVSSEFVAFCVLCSHFRSPSPAACPVHPSLLSYPSVSVVAVSRVGWFSLLHPLSHPSLLHVPVDSRSRPGDSPRPSSH